MPRSPTNPLAEDIYARVKDEIFDFRLLPGQRFTETEMAQRYGVSRTPVRDALYRLKREGFLDVAFRSGWSVQPLDFELFDDLYDMRIVLETAAIERICHREDVSALEPLARVWLADSAARCRDPREVSSLDEAFHVSLVEVAGNREMARVHRELTEKIRVVRRLDFLKPLRIDATYDEHAAIFKLIMRRSAAEASLLIRSHILESKSEVQKVTVQMLHEAREAMLAEE
jgi:DNA-binding GntR family transcriptional regulator